MAIERETRTSPWSTDELTDLYHNSPCGYHTLDPNGVFIRINDTELRWLGYTRHEVIGRLRFDEILTPESAAVFRKNQIAFKRRGWLKNLEFQMVRKDGSRIDVLFSSTAVFDREGAHSGSRATIFDITERKEAERLMAQQAEKIRDFALRMAMQRDELAEANQKLEALAVTDLLTELKNHLAFQELLEQEFQRAVRYGAPLSLLLIDLDRFREYNHAFGHNAGDELLKKIAQTLRTWTRETDWIARYGGEEFMVILTETDNQGALASAERIRAAVERIEGIRAPVTVSVGVATRGLTMPHRGALIAHVEQALTTAKEGGRNRVANALDR